MVGIANAWLIICTLLWTASTLEIHVNPSSGTNAPGCGERAAPCRDVVTVLARQSAGEISVFLQGAVLFPASRIVIGSNVSEVRGVSEDGLRPQARSVGCPLLEIYASTVFRDLTFTGCDS